MAEVDPDQEAALRRLRAAFGFVEVLRIVDHHDGQDQDDLRVQPAYPEVGHGTVLILVALRAN